MTIALRARRFWLVTFAAVVTVSVTMSLGQWQLRRAAQKQALHAAIVKQSEFSSLDNASFLATKDTTGVVHRTAQLRGTWQVSQTIFLDNRPMGGKTGFVVVTPLTLEDSQRVLLVQRGWVQRDFINRANLPNVQTATGVVTVSGRIAPPPSKLYEFQGVDAGQIRQNLDINAFAAEISQPLLPVSLLQTGSSSENLRRDWAAPNLGVEKHFGYAFQWFSLCALAVGLYVWFQIIQPLRMKKYTASKL